MIHMDNLNGEEQGRLHALIHGQTEFASFGQDINGRRITVWLMTPDALRRIEERLAVLPTPAAPEPETYAPPPPRVVPITTGPRQATPPTRRD